MPTFYIIRHAHKDQGNFYNSRLRHQDEPISQKGQDQARQLLPYLRDKGISAIYVSGYQRTGQTIEHVAEQLGLTTVVDERLNEIDNGLIEGLSDEEIRTKYPEVWEGFQKRAADFRFPEGETGEQACHRIAKFIEEKRQLHPHKNIVLVSHEGLMRILMCHLMGLPVYQRWNFQVDFCGIMEIVYQPDYQVWKLLRFNQQLFHSS
jgi:broad specificity phosphatase PhoE